MGVIAETTTLSTVAKIAKLKCMKGFFIPWCLQMLEGVR